MTNSYLYLLFFCYCSFCGAGGKPLPGSVAKITHIYSRAARKGMADTAAEAAASAAAATAAASGAVGELEMDEGSEGHTAAVQVHVLALACVLSAMCNLRAVSTEHLGYSSCCSIHSISGMYAVVSCSSKELSV
jgi:hypothetical protein